MEEFYEYLQSISIFDPPDAFGVIHKLSIEKIIDISIRCYTLTESSTEQIRNQSIFNFSASSTISGGIYPCAEADCRIKNVYELASFAALYADQVVIPNPFEHVYHHLSAGFKFLNEEHAYFFVNQLIGDIVVMLNLKPLIKNKLLTINPQVKTYCEECLKSKLLEDNKIQDAFQRIEDAVISDLNKNIKFILDTKRTILTEGPDGYLGHEVLRFAKLPKELKPYTKSIPYVFKPEEVKKLSLWEPVIIPIFQDLILQKYSMLNFNTAYLTNRKIETDIIYYLDRVPKENTIEKALINGLTHRLPFIENATLETLVKVRNQEAEAFAVYRDSVRKTIEESRGEADEDVIKKMVEDRIKPQLNKLNQIIVNHKDDFNSKAKRAVIFNSLLFTAGIFANQFSGIDLKTILELGGAYKLSEIFSDFSGANNIPQQVRNSDYYFLWKLEKGNPK